VPLNQDNVLAVRLWNLMGGINWESLPLLAEYFGVRNAETLLDGLLTIQDYQQRRQGAAQ